MSRILIVDRNAAPADPVVRTLREARHEVELCPSAGEALTLLSRTAFDVLLADLEILDQGGSPLFHEAGSRCPDAILILTAGPDTADSAAHAYRQGAHDFLPRPLSAERLQAKIESLVVQRETLAEQRLLNEASGLAPLPAGLVGTSRPMENLFRLIGKVALTDSALLLSGETGTGRESVAHAIHHAGPHRQFPFAVVRCAAAPEPHLGRQLFGEDRPDRPGGLRGRRGLLEIVDRGTVLVDEVADLPPEIQGKILRAIESRDILPAGASAPVPIRARILFATRRPLKSLAASGAFREDLLFRISSLVIEIPPLRDRRGDLEATAQALMARTACAMNRAVPALSPSARAILEEYSWPGNVQELGNVLERAMILSDSAVITPEELPAYLRPAPIPTGSNLKRARQAFERRFVERVLGECGGDKARAARELGIGLTSLYRKLGVAERRKTRGAF